MDPQGRGVCWRQNDRIHLCVRLIRSPGTGDHPGTNMEEKRPKKESQGPLTSKCCKDELPAKERRSGQCHRRRTRNG